MIWVLLLALVEGRRRFINSGNDFHHQVWTHAWKLGDVVDGFCIACEHGRELWLAMFCTFGYRTTAAEQNRFISSTLQELFHVSCLSARPYLMVELELNFLWMGFSRFRW